MAAPAASFLRPALLVAAVALLIRGVHLLQLRQTPYFSMLLGDARAYDQWAERLAAGDWIGSDVFYQAPLYPYFLGAIHAVVGHDLVAVRAVQAFLGAGSAVLLGYAACRWFSRRTGLAAGLLLALYAPAIFFDSLLQKSVLDVLFVSGLLAIVAVLTTGGHDRARWWLLLGVAAGALGLTRENALILAPLLAAWAFALAPHARLSPARSAALVLAGAVLLLAPVAARNYAVSGAVYLTTSQLGPNLYIGNHAGADGSYVALRAGRGSPEYERVDATEIAERAAGRTLTPREVSSYWVGRAWAFITGNPVAWLRLVARKTALLLNASEALDTESQESYAEWSWPLRVLGPVTHVGVLLPLAAFGVWVSWPERRRLWAVYVIGLTFAATTVAFYVVARYRFPLVPVLVLFAAVTLVQGVDAWRTRSASSRAVAAIAAAALAAVAQVPLLSPTRSRAITETNLGTAFHDDGRFEEAAAHFRRAIQLQPDYVPAFNNLGVTLRAQGRLDDAIAAYEQGLRLRADAADLHFNLANALLAENRADEAAAHFRQASAGAPDSAAVHNNLGTALAERGQLAAAAAEFERALALEPASAQAHRNLGNVLASLGQPDAALSHLRAAVAAAPQSPEAHYDLGVLLLQAESPAEAATSFRRAIALKPDDAEAFNNLGIALGSQGHLDDAIAAFESALRLRPGFPDAVANLAQARQAKR